MGLFSRSIWVLHYDASSCNGCDIEAMACFTPVYDVERFGVVNVGNPKHADVLLITGGVNEQSRPVVGNLYEQMPVPKAVVAVGACAACGNVFRFSYNVAGGVDKVIPVDVYVPGCAARPEAIIDGILQAAGVLDDEKQRRRRLARRFHAAIRTRDAKPEDAERILELEHHRLRYEAESYHQFGLLDETPSFGRVLTRIQSECYIAAEAENQVIGAAFLARYGNTGVISGISVDLAFTPRAIQTALVRGAEQRFRDVFRYLVYLDRADRLTLAVLRSEGYRIVEGNGGKGLWLRKEISKA